MFLYKKCEVCGNKINKLQSIWHIYTLQAGETIRCAHCGTYYQANKTIQTLISGYQNLSIGLYLWFILGICVGIWIQTLFNKNISLILAFVISFVLLGFINYIIACIIPLHKTNHPKEKCTKPFFYLLLFGFWVMVLLVFVAGFLGLLK